MILFIGNLEGGISMLKFSNPLKSLFNDVYKPIKGPMKLYWEDLPLHSEFVTFNIIKTVHTESIRKIQYIKLNNTLIASSGNTRSAVSIFDLENIKDNYNFKIFKVYFIILSFYKLV